MKMNSNILHGIAYLILSSVTAWGRIGETLDECITRYGEPDGPPSAFGGLSYWNAELPEAKIYSFTKGNIRVEMFLHNGTAQMMLFADRFIRESDPFGLDDERIETIISRNLVNASPAEQRDTPIGRAIAEEPALNHYFRAGAHRIPIRQCYVGENDVNALVMEDTRVFIVSNSFIDEMRNALQKGRAEQESKRQEQLQENQKNLNDL